MGSEFMPTLNEGSLLFMPVLLPSTSLTEVKRIMAWQDQVISQTPEVASVGGKLGRSETATDPAPIEMIETTIMLKPESQWRPGMTKEKLVAELEEKLSQMPGYVPGFLQPIENRILMISTGIRAQVGIKILGDNLDDLQKKAFEVERVVRTIPGAVGVAASRTEGKPYLDIEVDRAAMARYGLRAQDVMDLVEGGIGGDNVSTAIAGANGFRFKSGCNAANATTSSTSAIFSCRRRQATGFRSGRLRPSTAKSGRAKSTARTGVCACSCRRTSRAATSAVS
jgi:Cu(I)/Ag(I) efflux system membrane protein CusA/SilA